MIPARFGWATWVLLSACASATPPPVIETQEAQVGKPEEEDPPPVKPGVAETVGKPVEPGVAEPLPTDDGEPEIKLLSAGAEPRKVAKHLFKKGSVQRVMLKSKTRITGANLPIPPIGLNAPMEFKILDVDRETGTAKFNLHAGPFKSTQGSGGKMAGALGALLGAGGGGPPERIVGHGLVTPQGVIKEFEVDEGGNQDVAPIEVGDAFPSDPIGKGARWEVKVVLKEKDATIRQTSSYELLSFRGTTLRAKVERLQEPVSGEPDGPGSGQSSGTLEFRLGQIQATGKMQMEKALSISLPAVGDNVLKMQSEAEIKPRR